MRLVLLGCCLVSLVSPACGGEDRKPPFEGKGGTGGRGGASGASGKGGTQSDAGAAGEIAAGAGGQAGGETAGQPSVRITSPVEVSDPDSEDVLTGEEVTVTCEVDGDNVDESSVLIELLHEDEELALEAPGVRVGSTNEYAADFIIASIPNGALSFRCSASAEDANLTGTDEIDTLVDHGPTITVISPEIDSAHSLEGAIRFEFKVEAAPLAAGDSGAAVDDVVLVVEGMEVEAGDLDEAESGTYVTTIDFSDPVRFPDPPVGTIPVEIHAMNRRTPTPVEASLFYSFIIDGEGPVITIVYPDPDEVAVVGGEIPLQFRVDDPLAGVDPASVVVTLNTTEYRYEAMERWSWANDVFTFRFDSTLLSDSLTQATINITATDLAGNDSREGATGVLYLDNAAPIVDLDPAMVREYHTEDAVCSRAFDPVGISPNDLQVVPAVTPEIRALVWEQTNYASGATTLYYSGVDPGTVSVFLQPDPTVPLLVDTNDDGVCDDLAVDGLRRQVLTPIPPDGEAWFLQPPLDHPDLTAEPVVSGCPYASSGEEPDLLCDQENSDLTRVITQFRGNNDHSSIFGLGPLEEPACTGHQWEIKALATEGEGWICLASRALDRVGNIGISAPLRLCFDDPDEAGSPACVGGTTPPTCTDGCTLPGRYPSGHTDSSIELGPAVIAVDY
jgi:hypothetical protein